MKNRISIIVSDFKGAKHYYVNAYLKKTFLLIAFLLVVALVGIVLGLVWTSKQYSNLKQGFYKTEMSFFERLEAGNQRIENLLLENQDLLRQLELSEQQFSFLDDTLRSLESFVGSQSPEELVHIEDRIKLIQLNAIERQFLLQALPTGRPVVDFQGVSSGYGWRIHPTRGIREFHHGIDYRGNRGDGVIATADGIVEYAGYSHGSGYGNLVIITHAYGFKTYYAHLDSFNVRAGQYVRSGDLIGEIGNTGVSTGPHLHYEVRFINRKLDPAPFVQWGMENYEEIFEQVESVPWGSLVQAVHQQVQLMERQLLQQALELQEN